MRWKKKLCIMAVLSSSCLFQTTGCPQIFGNAIKDGTRSFLETGLPTAIISAFNAALFAELDDTGDTP